MNKKTILYTFRRCPYAMRARMALAAANIDFEPREILLKDKPKSMLQYSPKGTVPVLVLPDETVIDESLDVMLWALKHENGQEYFPQSEEAKAFAFEQVKVLDQEFKKNLDVCKYHVRFSEEEFTRAKEQAFSILSSWNQILEEHAFFHGDIFGFLDMAIFPFVRQFFGITPDIFSELNVPRLKSWLASGLKSDFFHRAMEKYPLWEE